MDLITTRGLSKEFIEKTLSLAQKFEPIAREKKRVNVLDGKSVACLFFEPSTRTQMSFQAAISLCGGRRIGFGDARASSSVKGESLYDTIKMVDSYASCIVMRHPLAGSAAKAAEVAEAPVINAGDRDNQHPTQALLDLYTIKKLKGGLDGLTIQFAGDLKHGRTVHSLAYALSNYDVTIELFSPPNVRLPADIVKELSQSVKVKEVSTIGGSADVVYATRIQRERFADKEEYEKAAYVIDPELMKMLKKDAILMHPLPRFGEVSEEVDSDPRAKYFEQAFYGLPVRMAVLSLLLNGRDV